MDEITTGGVPGLDSLIPPEVRDNPVLYLVASIVLLGIRHQDKILGVFRGARARVSSARRPAPAVAPSSTFHRPTR